MTVSMEPICVCLLTNDPTRQQRWRETLALGPVNFLVFDDRTSHAADLVISDRPVPDEELTAITGELRRDEVAVVSVGSFEFADVKLPADCSDRELHLACELLAQAICLRRERNSLMQTVERLTHLAFSDPLTGLPNRRAWERDVPKMFEAVRQGEQPFCLALLDLDNFKHLNDRFGHPAGDEVLRNTGRKLTQNLMPQHDYVARLGGDEFGLVVSGLQVNDAREHVEKARVSVARSLNDPDTPSCTASAGLAFVGNQACRCWQDLLLAADDALRHAKACGRNQTIAVQVNQLNPRAANATGSPPRPNR